MGKIKRIRRSAAMWRELFSRQSSSGVSVPEFCRREGINASLFRRWRSSLEDSGKVVRISTRAEPAAEAPAPFIDLGGIGLGGPRFEVRLELGAGVVLSIARG
jgi:Transposase